MTVDAKAAEKRRLAEALRANLRRRKAARGGRVAQPASKSEADGSREPPPDPER